VRVSQPRLEPAGERLIGQQRSRGASASQGRARAGAWSRCTSAGRSASRRRRARRLPGTKPDTSASSRSVRSTNWSR
jgi:hypothetical protein